MKCKRNALLKGIIGGASVGLISAVAAGYGIASLCSKDCKKLKKKARRALHTVKNYIDGMI